MCKRMQSMCVRVSCLLLEELCVGRAGSSEQVEWAMCRVAEALQLLLPVALLRCFNGPLLLGGALMGGRGRLGPAQSCLALEGFVLRTPKVVNAPWLTWSLGPNLV